MIDPTDWPRWSFILWLWVITVGAGWGFGMMLTAIVRAVRMLTTRPTLDDRLAPWDNRTGDN